LTYTEEQMQDAKKDRATLNAMRKAISDRRIEVKKALLAPYNTFEAEVKEVVALIDKPIAMIDEQTKAYEDKVKEEKRKSLIEYFKENVGELSDVLTFDMIFNQKWLNKTSSIKSCKEEISSAIEKTETDLKTIETMIEEKYKGYAKDFYFRKGQSITSVLNEVGRMRKIDREAEEKRLAKEKQERLREQEDVQTEEPINPPIEPEKEQEQVADPFADKDTDTKIYKASFTIRGTKAQILSVKEFMLNNNIQFGKVEK
jgi:hypothetical protein